MADANVAENDTHDKRNRVKKIIVEAGDAGISRADLIRKIRSLKARELGEILDALILSEEIFSDTVETKSKPRLMFFEKLVDCSHPLGKNLPP